MDYLITQAIWRIIGYAYGALINALCSIYAYFNEMQYLVHCTCTIKDRFQVDTWVSLRRIPYYTFLHNV